MIKYLLATSFLFLLVSCNDEPPLIPGLTKSSVFIRTDPAIASVYFNNASVSVSTPAYFDDLEPGFFRVHFKASKYRDTSFFLFTKRNVADTIFVQITEDPQYWWTKYSAGTSPLPTNSINKIIRDKDNGILLLTANKGIVRFDGTGWSIIESGNSGLPDDTVNDLAIDKNGVYWIATDEGLARFDGVHWTVYNRSNASLPENKITCVTVDKNQIVWFGTYNSGLVKFDGVSFTTYSIFNSELPSNNVTTLLTDYLNVKWVGTRNEGAASFDGIDWKVYNLLKSGLQSDNILSIASDNAGEIWVGSGDGLSIGGLSKIKNGTVTNYSKLNSRLPGQFVSSINLDSKGVVWAATSDGGVAKFDGTTWRVYTMYNSGLKINNLLSVCVDGNDNKWIAGDGLYLYTGQK